MSSCEDGEHRLFEHVPGHQGRKKSFWERIIPCLAADVPKQYAHSFLQRVVKQKTKENASKDTGKRTKRKRDEETMEDYYAHRPEYIAHDPVLSMAKRVCKQVFSDVNQLDQHKEVLSYFTHTLQSSDDENDNEITLTEEQVKQQLKSLEVQALEEGRLRVLVCPKSAATQTVMEFLQPILSEYACKLTDAFVLSSTAKDSTLAQYEQLVTWPLNASSRQPNTTVTELSAKELENACSCFALAIPKIKQGKWRSCILYDPDVERIVTYATENGRQGENDEHMAEFFKKAVPELRESHKFEYLKRNSEADDPTTNPLDTAVMACIENVALVDRLLRNNDAIPEDCRQLASLRNQESYLCTGYYAFLTVEPDPMDAMALLHSRIRRVVYLCSEPKQGCLGTTTTLHGSPLVNHRYEVFRPNYDNLSALSEHIWAHCKTG